MTVFNMEQEEIVLVILGELYTRCVCIIYVDDDEMVYDF